VVYDRLAASVLPCDLPASTEIHSVGKEARHHPVTQEDINALLLRLAGEGKRVVRLKGGDPYVFGRGGEEAEALVEAGIPFEVVPAVTAGVAVPAYAGIPVTHRRETVRVTLVTAHEAVKSGGPQVRWDLLARDPHATLLGYMGVTSLPNVVEKLLAAGMAPQTPAALIERGTTPAQRIAAGTVAELPRLAATRKIRPPALFVIGPTVQHMARLNWLEQLPLFGERLLFGAPVGKMGEALARQGAEILEVPLPLRPAARIALGAGPLTGCVLRDPDEVDALDEERDGPGWSSETTAWCLCPRTAARARSLGWPRIVELPDGSDGAALAQALAEARRR
jgi:uroporphyrinogen III methyltransferase/synthase